MNIFKLKNIKEPFFSLAEIAQQLDITIYSARVTASRYTRSGILIRAARDLYILKDSFQNLDIEERFKLANRIQPSSYISFGCALSYFGISTQVRKDFFESAGLIRSKEKAVDDSIFRYFKLNRKYYFGFERKIGFFIARPEKAFLDSIYLMSMGRYSLDIASLSLKTLNKKVMDEFLKEFPEKTRKLWEDIRERID